MKGRVLFRKSEIELQLIGSWHTAVLNRNKTIPPLKKFLDIDEQTEPQTPDQMWAVAKMLDAVINMKANKNGK